MSWWWWVLIWVLLALAAAGIFALLGLSLYRKAKLLLKDLGAASERLSVISEGLQSVADAASEPAVFTDPSRLRQERILAARGHIGTPPAKPATGRGKRSRAQRVR